MTQITKEQLEEALTDVGLDTIDLDVIRSYITQLEANQRHPVSDEKLKEAMQWLTFYKIKNGESSRKTLSVEFHFDSIDPDTRESALSRYMRHMDEIEAALSELETLRADRQWVWINGDISKLPKKPGKERYEQIQCAVIRNGYMDLLMWNCEYEVWDDRTGDDFECAPLDVDAYLILEWQKKPLPTPPVQEVR